MSKCLKLSNNIKIPSAGLLRTWLDTSHKCCTVAVAACRRVRHSQMPQHHHKPQNIKHIKHTISFMSRVKCHNDLECLRSELSLHGRAVGSAVWARWQPGRGLC